MPTRHYTPDCVVVVCACVGCVCAHACVCITAAWMGHLEVMGLLLEHGALVNAQTSRGETPLWNAAGNGRAEAVRLLLQRGAWW